LFVCHFTKNLNLSANIGMEKAGACQGASSARDERTDQEQNPPTQIIIVNIVGMGGAAIYNQNVQFFWELCRGRQR